MASNLRRVALVGIEENPAIAFLGGCCVEMGSRTAAEARVGILPVHWTEEGFGDLSEVGGDLRDPA
jgi:hypothetical protein